MAAVSVEQIETLLEELRRRFEADYAANPVIAAVVEKAERGEATYADARRYASEVDRLCGRATADFTLRTSQGVDPAFYRDNFREFHAALLPNVLDRNYQLIADYCEKVQKGLNEGAGLGLKAQRVWQDQDRVTGIVKHVTRADSPEQAAQRASTDVETLDQHYVDRSIQVNADFQWKAGLRPKIVRIGGANCCEWCAEVEGAYDYPDVPKDVYRRHAHCTCDVEYDPADGKGQTQNVHDKRRWTDYAATEKKLRERREFGLPNDRDPAKIEERKTFGLEDKAAAKEDWNKGIGPETWAFKEQKAMYSAEWSSTYKRVEEAWVYDASGKRIFYKVGSTGEVTFTRSEYQRFQNAILTHNHPKGYSLSPHDINFLRSAGLQEIRAVTSTGIYRIQRPENWDSQLLSLDGIQRKYDEINNRIDTEIFAQAHMGRYSLYEAERRTQEETVRLLCEETHLPYSFVSWDEIREMIRR